MGERAGCTDISSQFAAKKDKNKHTTTKNEKLKTNQKLNRQTKLIGQPQESLRGEGSFSNKTKQQQQQQQNIGWCATRFTCLLHDVLFISHSVDLFQLRNSDTASFPQIA